MIKIKDCKKIMKVCTHCGELKHINKYYKDKQKQDNLSSRCKKCIYIKKDIVKNKKAKRCVLEQEFLGMKFGFLTVESINREHEKNDKHIYYNCKCICGKNVVVPKTLLKNGKRTSCGCKGENNLKGKTHYMLTAVSNAYHKEDGMLYIDVVCSCGKEKTIPKQYFFNDNVKSCGHYNKEKEGLKGEKHPNWNPNLTEKDRKANNSRSSEKMYRNTRKLVLKRDDYTCQCCGKKNKKGMRVHHLNSFSTHKNERYDLNNLITLCDHCHDIQFKGSFHNIFGNGNNTKEQFEEFKQRYHNKEF